MTYKMMTISKSNKSSKTTIRVSTNDWNRIDELREWIDDHYYGMSEDGVYQNLKESETVSWNVDVENSVYAKSYSYVIRIGNEYVTDDVYIIKMEV